MASTFENNESSLSKLFDEQLKMFHDIENSDLPSTSEELKEKILTSIKILEELTVSVSYLGVFSCNESFEEIPTSSIKFLMLPVLLGALTLRLHKSDRGEVLKVAHVYFKDFLRRCSNYELANCTDTAEDGMQTSELESLSVPKKDLRKMATQREEKIARYKKKKSLNDKLGQLKEVIENPSPDEEIVREYYLTMINESICQSYDELDSISMELSMLQQVRQMNVNKEHKSSHQEQVSQSLKPFLITKDAIQKRVFGAGYPSLPVMSVEEFYEQRVKEGWFPPNAREPASQATEVKVPLQSNAEEVEEDDDDDDIEKLRQRDEWRDTHRRGWGNTFNRS